MLRSLLGKGFSSTESSDRGNPLCGRSAQRQQITYKIFVRAGTPQQDRIQCLHLTKACPRQPLGGVANSNRRYPFLGPTPRKLARRPTRCIYYVTTEYIKAHNVCVSLACGFKFVVPLPYLPFRFGIATFPFPCIRSYLTIKLAFGGIYLVAPQSIHVMCLYCAGGQFPCGNALQNMQYGNTIGHFLLDIVHILFASTIAAIYNFQCFQFHCICVNVCIKKY